MAVWLAVDLAAKYSAWMVRDSDGKVLLEADSRELSATDTVEAIVSVAVEFNPSLILIEDVPYGIGSQAQTKPVTRLQGMLIYKLVTTSKVKGEVYFINPSSWQKFFPGVARGPAADRVESARIHAKRLGYTPPDLVQHHIDALPEGAKVLKKHTNVLAKVMTDYIDAFLMTEFIKMHDGEVTGQPGIQPPFV